MDSDSGHRDVEVPLCFGITSGSLFSSRAATVSADPSRETEDPSALYSTLPTLPEEELSPRLWVGDPYRTNPLPSHPIPISPTLNNPETEPLWNGREKRVRRKV